MAGCVLRVAGESFSPEAFLEESSFKPVRVFATGFNLMVSDRDGDDLSGQIEDAFAFLRTHASEVSRLVSFKGVEGVSLDFGVWQQDRPAQSFIFPAMLVAQAGRLGIGLDISAYAASDS